MLFRSRRKQGEGEAQFARSIPADDIDRSCAHLCDQEAWTYKEARLILTHLLGYPPSMDLFDAEFFDLPTHILAYHINLKVDKLAFFAIKILEGRLCRPCSYDAAAARLLQQHELVHPYVVRSLHARTNFPPVLERFLMEWERPILRAPPVSVPHSLPQSSSSHEALYSPQFPPPAGKVSASVSADNHRDLPPAPIAKIFQLEHVRGVRFSGEGSTAMVHKHWTAWAKTVTRQAQRYNYELADWLEMFSHTLLSNALQYYMDTLYPALLLGKVDPKDGVSAVGETFVDFAQVTRDNIESIRNLKGKNMPPQETYNFMQTRLLDLTPDQRPADRLLQKYYLRALPKSTRVLYRYLKLAQGVAGYPSLRDLHEAVKKAVELNGSDDVLLNSSSDESDTEKHPTPRTPTKKPLPLPHGLPARLLPNHETLSLLPLEPG